MLRFCLLLSSSDLHIFITFFCFAILWLERIQSKARLIHICNSNISSRSEMLSSWIVLLLKLTEVTSPRILSHNSKRVKYIKIYYNCIREYPNIINILNSQVRIGTLMLWQSIFFIAFFYLVIAWLQRIRQKAHKAKESDQKKYIAR